MWEYVIGGVTLWGAVFGLIMFYNGRITRKVLTKILTKMEKNQEAMLKNLEAMREDHETMIAALQKTLSSSS